MSDVIKEIRTARDKMTKRTKSMGLSIRADLQSQSVQRNTSHPLRQQGQDSMAPKTMPSRCKVLGHVLRSSSGSVLPGLLVPAWPTFAQRQFSTTTKRPSKLGRTPITIPPGVELSMGDLKKVKSKTSYKPTVNRRITVKGPLGEFSLARGRSGGFALPPECRSTCTAGRT